MNIGPKGGVGKSMDLRLSSAIYNKCDYSITCDDKLKGIIGDIRLYNPVDFLRKEMDINVIE